MQYLIVPFRIDGPFLNNEVSVVGSEADCIVLPWFDSMSKADPNPACPFISETPIDEKFNNVVLQLEVGCQLPVQMQDIFSRSLPGTNGSQSLSIS